MKKNPYSRLKFIDVLYYKHLTPRWNSLSCGYQLRSFTKVRQQGELYWALQLHPLGQQIS